MITHVTWPERLTLCFTYRKNHSDALKSGSKVAACVIELQKRLVNARVVYCSATGVSEIGNMAYMARLGFWGAGTYLRSQIQTHCGGPITGDCLRIHSTKD